MGGLARHVDDDAADVALRHKRLEPPAHHESLQSFSGISEKVQLDSLKAQIYLSFGQYISSTGVDPPAPLETDPVRSP
jgi:hypothetical protein